MWMLSFVPDAWLQLAVLGVLGTGLLIYVISYFTVFIPPLIPAKEFIRILGTLVIVAGVFFYGSYDTEMSWRKKVAEVEAQVAAAEAASKKANVKIEARAQERIRMIYKNATIVKQYIDREVVKYDETCKIPDAVVKAHNAAAKNEEIK
jgi:apolipoprotein N-acyltransferase